MKAATFTLYAPSPAWRISIHAAREGGDGCARHRSPRHRAISIHAAREGGDAWTNLVTGIASISIHAAREGGDAIYSLRAENAKNISIHAAREGGDSLGG